MTTLFTGPAFPRAAAAVFPGWRQAAILPRLTRENWRARWSRAGLSPRACAGRCGALVDEQLEAARRAPAGRAARTVVGGHENVMRQTVIALLGGRALAEHEPRRGHRAPAARSGPARRGRGPRRRSGETSSWYHPVRTASRRPKTPPCR